MSNYYFIKVFPSIGEAFIIGLPESVQNCEQFLSDVLQNVEYLEPLEN